MNIHQDLENADNVLDALLAEIPDATLKEQVSIGIILSKLLKRIKGAQERLKPLFRDAALKQLQGNPGIATLNGSLGSVLVSIPPPMIRLRKDADIEALKKAIGIDMETYFEVSYKPRANIGTLVLNLPEGTQKEALWKALEEVSETPRVSFKED